ncbi:transposase [Streptomyces virginiae]|uniref:transposase n=1 Tax=Streptomyces virginiae TaxID=1961 RepID=UPI0036A708C1
MLVRDGLKGLPDAVNSGRAFRRAQVSEGARSARRGPAEDRDADLRRLSAVGLVLLCRPSGLDKTAKALKLAGDAEASRFLGSARNVAAGSQRSSGCGRTRAEFVPFLQFDAGIRRSVCGAKAIESVNAPIRRAVRARGHFPSEDAAMKCSCHATMPPPRPAPDANVGPPAGRGSCMPRQRLRRTPHQQPNPNVQPTRLHRNLYRPGRFTGTVTVTDYFASDLSTNYWRIFACGHVTLDERKGRFRFVRAELPHLRSACCRSNFRENYRECRCEGLRRASQFSETAGRGSGCINWPLRIG